MTEACTEQRFEVGYHLNSWDLAGLPLEDGLEFLADAGVGWFEALARDSFSTDFVRRFMRVGDVEPPAPSTDTALWERVATFSHAQSASGVRLASLYCNAEYVNPRTWPHERATLEAIARVLAGFGAPVLVVGGGPPLEQTGLAADDAFDRLRDALEDLGRRVTAFGVRVAYHPHLDTLVESRADVDRLMDGIDVRLAGLCVDPAHLQLAGADPVQVVRDYGEALVYMHLKDALAATGPGAARYAAFCELGAGEVELAGVVDGLRAADYDGLAIVELDLSQTSAEGSARQSLAYLRDTLGVALEAA